MKIFDKNMYQHNPNRNSLFNLASELFDIHMCLPGYEILAFEKPCLHYHKISSEARLIYTGLNGNEPIENMQLYTGYSLEK